MCSKNVKEQHTFPIQLSTCNSTRVSALLVLTGQHATECYSYDLTHELEHNGTAYDMLITECIK